jgi:L,D-transpeptidase YbiS
MSPKKVLLLLLAGVYTAFLIALGLAYKKGFEQASAWRAVPEVRAETKAAGGKAAGRRQVQGAGAMRKSLEALKPRDVYIIVDTGENRLYLMKGQEVLRTAVVSCGSGEVLEDPSGKRKWVFDTPRGEFAVKSKVKNPYWVKPDWAFIEEGEPIPPKNSEARFEAGTLGDYALGFGEGYFIHGTLYTRLLGRNVTHGCIRVGDEDLEAVFKAAQVGTKIYIY